MSKNKNFNIAKKNKNDEFYTQYDDIEKEVNHYEKQLEGKIIYCNCDDPKSSHFYRFFIRKYNDFKLKGLITTYYPKKDNEKGYMLKIDEEIINDLMKKHKLTREDLFKKFKDEKNPYLPPEIPLKGDEEYSSGDFRSKESVDILKEYKKDLVVITNPPFSLFREYVAQLMEYKVKFLIIGNITSIQYKKIFPLIKENKIWLGVSPRSMEFIKPDGLKKGVNACWFTNLNHKKRNEEIYLIEKYKGNESKFPKYDNYDAINVDLTKDIPKDYAGVMGVPITFLDSYDPEQFEIISLGIVGSCEFLNNYKQEIYKDGEPTGKFTKNCKGCLYYKYDSKIHKKSKAKYKNVETEDFYIAPYSRILIKNKKVEK